MPGLRKEACKMTAKKVFFIGFLVTALTMLIATPVMAASGEVTFINPPERVGKIKRTDDSSNRTYIYQIPQDLSDPNNALAVGDAVTFDVDPPPAKVAQNVAKEGN